MKRLVFCLCAALLAAFSVSAQDYKLDVTDTSLPPLTAPYASVPFQKPAYRVIAPGGPWCEIWMRASIPAGQKGPDPSVTFAIPQGALVGILRFEKQGADRRGQPIKPGLYTMRYSLYPVDGAHQGVAPQRDFLLLTPVANDADPNAMPSFEALVKMSVAASGSSHPAVLSIETPAEGSKFPSVVKEGDHDQVLNVKVGDLGISIIVAGKYEG